MTQSDIIIPPGFIAKFVWSPFKDIAADGAAEPMNNPSSDHPQSYAFPDGVVSEVLAAASYAFSPTSQIGAVEPNICLFTPYEGCHDIVDSMIQSVANQLNADVIVLDAIELALGEFGALGEGTSHYQDNYQLLGLTAISVDIGRAINAVYEPKPKLDPSRIQAAFDAIVTVSNKVQSCTGVDLTEPSKCRFIYLRDFGSIARSAKPFMTRLLHAIRVRRVSGRGGCRKQWLLPSRWRLNASAAYGNEKASNSSGILHPTVLIMGFDKASTIGSEVDFSDTVALFRSRKPKPFSRSKSSIFSEGGSTLRETLPLLDSQLFCLKAQFSEISLQALPAAFFLPLVSKPSQMETTVLSSAKNTFLPALQEECICLIPRNFEQNAVCDLLHCAEIKRKTDVQNMLMVLFLKQRGFLVADDLNSVVSADTSAGGTNLNNVLLSDILGDHPDIPFPVAVSRIATKAIGLAHRRPHAETPIQIDAEDISKARAMFIENSQTFSNWLNKVEGRREAEDQNSAGTSEKEKEEEEEKEKEKKDPIVESVKNCRDLNQYEKKLLQCIVDCGE
ncbi:hypothetical protein B0H13DRAFT_2308502 [Mycena leptocephala]|nr:hypothetical protein B0H13DRAFT_2308502 [Mycena leptocephala]